jgi:regulator of RNase E activity RraA
VVVGDSDGIVAVPCHLAEQVARLSHAQVVQEQEMIASIVSGTYSSAWVGEALKQKGVER